MAKPDPRVIGRYWSDRLDTNLHLLNEIIPVEAAEEAKQAATDDAEAIEEAAEEAALAEAAEE